MPLYEYKCHGCGKKFEVIQKFADEPLTKHEECGGDVERLISAPAFHFKGTGWYVTDYAKGNSGAPKSDGGKSDADARSSESKSHESKSHDTKSHDTKTETKAESKPAESKPAESKPAPAPAAASDSK
jgi:putative FmdB family regulatory protein